MDQHKVMEEFDREGAGIEVGGDFLGIAKISDDKKYRPHAFTVS